MDTRNRQEIVGPVDTPSGERRGRSIELQAVTTLASAPAANAPSFEAFFAEIVRKVVREELATAAVAPPSLPTNNNFRPSGENRGDIPGAAISGRVFPEASSQSTCQF